jgi:hypothetical protein
MREKETIRNISILRGLYGLLSLILRIFPFVFEVMSPSFQHQKTQIVSLKSSPKLTSRNPYSVFRLYSSNAVRSEAWLLSLPASAQVLSSWIPSSVELAIELVVFSSTRCTAACRPDHDVRATFITMINEGVHTCYLWYDRA